MKRRRQHRAAAMPEPAATGPDLAAPIVPALGAVTAPELAASAAVGATEPADELGRKVASGVRWGTLDQLVQQTLRFSVTVALTRLLSPADFGIAGMAFVFSEFGSMLGDVGMAPALVYRRELDDKHVRASFTGGGLFGLGLAALLVGASWPLAAFFGQPRLRLILAVLSLNYVFKGLTGTPHYLLRRDLYFRPFVVCYGVSVALGGALGIVIAALGGGPWALVAYSIAEAAIHLLIVVLYIQRGGRWHLGFGLDHQAVRDLLGFGASVSGSRLLIYGRQNLDNLLVGRYRGARALGLYDLAYSIMLYPIQRVSDIVASVAFPALSRLKEDMRQLSRAFLRALRTVCLVCFPVSLGSMITSPLFVPLVFGHRWGPAVATVEILALNGPRLALNALNTSVLQAIGRPAWDFWLNLASFVLASLGFVIAVSHGIAAVAAAFTISGYLLLPVSQRFVLRSLGLRLTELLRAVAPVAVATACMILAAELIRVALQHSLGTAVTLGAMVAVGAGAYFLALSVFGRSILTDVMDNIVRR